MTQWVEKHFSRGQWGNKRKGPWMSSGSRIEPPHDREMQFFMLKSPSKLHYMQPQGHPCHSRLAFTLMNAMAEHKWFT